MKVKYFIFLLAVLLGTIESSASSACSIKQYASISKVNANGLEKMESVLLMASIQNTDSDWDCFLKAVESAKKIKANESMSAYINSEINTFWIFGDYSVKKPLGLEMFKYTTVEDGKTGNVNELTDTKLRKNFLGDQKGSAHSDAVLGPVSESGPEPEKLTEDQSQIHDY